LRFRSFEISSDFLAEFFVLFLLVVPVPPRTSANFQDDVFLVHSLATVEYNNQMNIRSIFFGKIRNYLEVSRAKLNFSGRPLMDVHWPLELLQQGKLKEASVVKNSPLQPFKGKMAE
jgi:hypothetical protein